MGRWHIDAEIDRMMVQLIDALCAFERNTGRRSHFLFVPEADDEKIIYAMDGKPVSHTPYELAMDLDLIKSLIRVRGSS